MADGKQTAEEAGIVSRPLISIKQNSTLHEAKSFMRAHGVSSLAVIEGSRLSPYKLVGLLTQRDMRYHTDLETPISELMAKDRLITVREGITVYEAKKLLRQFRINRLLVVDDNYVGVGMITNANIRKLDNTNEVEIEISKAAAEAPIFVPIDGRISHRQKPDEAYVVSERVAVARERCAELLDVCKNRANEQPEISKAAHQYSKSLDLLSTEAGSYRLFVSGVQIENIVQIKEAAPTDPERNPPFSADLMLAVRALIVAHAGLVSALPDLRTLSQEFGIYEDQLTALKQIAEVRPFEPALKALAESDGIFDIQTGETTKAVAEMANNPSINLSRGVAAVEQAWLRGSLAAMGSYIVSQWSYFKGKFKDTMTTETIKGVIYHPGILISAIYTLFQTAKPHLLVLADTLPAAFGWLRSMLNLLGI